MALPRLTEFVPVIFDFNPSNPPGMPRFLATCMAATHCPRFLNPVHALLRLPPGTEIPLFSRALVSEVSNLPLSRTLLGDSDAALECPIPFEPMLLERPLLPGPTSDGAPEEPGPTPAGRPQIRRRRALLQGSAVKLGNSSSSQVPPYKVRSLEFGR